MSGGRASWLAASCLGALLSLGCGTCGSEGQAELSESERARRNAALFELIWSQEHRPTSEDPLEAAVSAALEDAWRYMLGRRRLAADVIFALRRIGEGSPDPHTYGLLDIRAQRYVDDPQKGLLFPGERIELPEEFGVGLRGMYDGTLSPFGKDPARARRMFIHFQEQRGYGYYPPHQMMACALWTEEGRTLPDGVLDDCVFHWQYVRKEQAKQTAFSDIYAERAALLALFGDPCLDDLAHWAEVILPAQQLSGAWKDGERESRHATVLAMVALQKFLDATRRPWERCISSI